MPLKLQILYPALFIVVLNTVPITTFLLVLDHPSYYYPMIKTQYGWSDGKTTVWNDEWEWRKAQEK